MHLKQIIGKIGEQKACNYLEKNNYIIIDKNFYCRQGEIDIIAKDIDRNELLFVEVKSRTNFKFGKPSESVNKKKRNHIFRVAEYYLYIKKIKNENIRLDVIEIYFNIYTNKFRINHIKQVI